jgi:hypothetical protein
VDWDPLTGIEPFQSPEARQEFVFVELQFSVTDWPCTTVLWLGDSLTLGASVEVELPVEEAAELDCDPEPDWPSLTQADSVTTNARTRETCA